MTTALTDRLLSVACVVAASLVALAPAVARDTCPTAVVGATQLIVVIADNPDAPGATLTSYSRPTPDKPWVRALAPEPAVVGLAGVAWGAGFGGPGERRKVEGDRRAPAGIYPLGRTFGTAASPRAGHLRLEPENAYCVDDTASPYYNRIVARRTAGDKTSGEKMWSEPLYRLGIVIDYPADRTAKAGSCIFLHVWRDAGKGTAGCVAMPEASIARLQDWVEPGRAAIAILAKGWQTRFSGCLP